ncbi:MAG: hypothetical protein ACI9FN_001943 [Saprospiraceae bacterium]|jgi:hypothetical protein
MQKRVILIFVAALILMSYRTLISNTTHVSDLIISTTDLSELDFWKDYKMDNTEFGTKTIVSIKKGKRIIQTNALPNHPTGSFPNPGNPNSIKAQKVKYILPLNPKLSGESKWAREPGVALNGVKFEPETAERFICETGEVYRIEAFQELVDLGLDFNHAHVQPTGAYHYHGVPVGLVESLDTEEDVVLVGFAKDGFPIYYSQSGRYKPSFQLIEDLRRGDACSYRNPKQGMNKELKDTKPDGTFVSDWDYVAGLGELDECNGIDIDGRYGYFVTDEYPYISRCLKGEFKEDRPKGPPPGRHRHGSGPPHRH